MPKIKKEISKTLEKFLNDEYYLEKFREIVIDDYEDDDELRMALFNVQDGQIIFVDPSLEDMFLEFQLFEQLAGTPPYDELLEKHPERRGEITEVGKKILNGEEVNDDDVIYLFREEE